MPQKKKKKRSALEMNLECFSTASFLWKAIVTVSACLPWIYARSFLEVNLVGDCCQKKMKRWLRGHHIRKLLLLRQGEREYLHSQPCTGLLALKCSALAPRYVKPYRGDGDCLGFRDSNIQETFHHSHNSNHAEGLKGWFGFWEKAESLFSQK